MALVPDPGASEAKGLSECRRRSVAPVWPSLEGRNTVSVRGGSAHGPQAGGSDRLRVSTRRIGVHREQGFA